MKYFYSKRRVAYYIYDIGTHHQFKEMLNLIQITAYGISVYGYRPRACELDRDLGDVIDADLSSSYDISTMPLHALRKAQQLYRRLKREVQVS